MAKHESVLTTNEKESFIIKKFIFHIIDKDNVNPIYLDEVILTKEQEGFFKSQFAKVSEGVQYVFKDEVNSDFVDHCKKLLSNLDSEFVNISKALTASFKNFHTGTTNDGVFITSVVEVLGDRHLIFLLKVDHRKVYQYTVTGTKALLNEIQKTFVEDKGAIQKCALIDISDHYAWDVLASDKKITGDKLIRDYFAAFLTVVEKEVPSVLTRKALASVSKWARNNKNILTEDPSFYKNRALDYLNSTPKFSSKNFVAAVTHSSAGKKIYDSFNDYLDEIGLSGQRFKPKPDSIRPSQSKNIRETAEGVKIEWTGDAKEKNITIPIQKNPNDGLYHITIKTSSIIDKQ